MVHEILIYPFTQHSNVTVDGFCKGLCLCLIFWCEILCLKVHWPRPKPSVVHQRMSGASLGEEWAGQREDRHHDGKRECQGRWDSPKKTQKAHRAVKMFSWWNVVNACAIKLCIFIIPASSEASVSLIKHPCRRV